MSDPFVRNPCRYPDEVRARAPRGLRDRLRQAAHAEPITMGEFVRRAVSERMDGPRRSWQDSTHDRRRENRVP